MTGKTNSQIGSGAHSGTTNPSNGVYIRDTYGYCHKESEWTGEYTADSVVVVTDNCSFRIALKQYSEPITWGGNGVLVTNITSTSNISEAQNDFDGKDNTIAILGQLGNNASSAPAAYYCSTFTFPDGSTGYLGSAGEWTAALNNKVAIESALAKCGGESLNNYNWTSTQYGSNYAWYIRWETGVLTDTSKTTTVYIRVFAEI